MITGADGAFAYTTKPQLLTSYLATWKGATSLAATVAVAPVITFGRNNGWVSKVYAGRSMVSEDGPGADGLEVRPVGHDQAGSGRAAGTRARFTLPLSKGVHKLRIAMSVNQAGTIARSDAVTIERWIADAPDGLAVDVDLDVRRSGARPRRGHRVLVVVADADVVMPQARRASTERRDRAVALALDRQHVAVEGDRREQRSGRSPRRARCGR